MSIVFGWKRFWCPRGGTINLSDGGFLSDPTSEYGKFDNPELVTFDMLTDKPALALLGEPGIGKSWALQAERASVEAAIQSKGEQTLWLDLRGFSSEDRLWKTLFEAEEVRRWRSGDHILNVFLDSLDECLLRIDNVATLIADQLPNEPVHRLRWRIACRTAPWPMILERSLITLFGKEGFEAYELAPLTRRDVIHAAERSRIANPDAFLSRIEGLDATSLAIKPVTLKFLTNTYLRNGDLPANQVDLYEKGCRILCEESNESRMGSGQRGQLSVAQRLAIAARVAAVTQFGNRYAVWTETEGEEVPPEDILLRDITGGMEANSENIAVSTEAVREVLDTGLFSSRGPGRIGWAHQTYAEFLAAHYCRSHEMPPQQIRSLLFHPEGSEQRLVPQLHELAAWVSVTNPAILEMVANSDPESLLGAAAASLSDDQRKLVTSVILNQSDAGRPLNLRWNIHRLYRKLKHPGLAGQLRPYLQDKARCAATRYVSIQMALSCMLHELGPELADIALDVSEEADLRSMAAFVAAKIGSPEARQRLRPLAYGQAGDDPDDELKGSGLWALWPELMSSDELFQLLSRPKRSNLSGAYSSFLYNQAPLQLGLADLPAALKWFSKQGHHSLGPIDRLMDEIVRLAWERLDSPVVAAGLATAVLSRIKLQDRLMSDDRGEFGKQIRADRARRQMLLHQILPQLKEQNDLFWLDHAGVELIPEEDFPWLVRRILSCESPSSQIVEARLVHRVVDTRVPSHVQTLWLACKESQILHSECKDLFEPVPLDSEQARILRDNLRHQKIRKPELLDPPPPERIEQNLRSIELGKISDWVPLTWNLSLRPDSHGWEDNIQPDLTSMPGWKAATEETKERILSAALRYSNDGDPENDKWLNTTQIFHSAIAGFRALALLVIASPDKLEAVSIKAWRKWVPILLKYPHGGQSELRLQLLHVAHRNIPTEVAGALSQMIEHESATTDYFFREDELESCWDKRLAQGLRALVEKRALKPDYLRAILQCLLRHDVDGTRDLAKSFILDPPPESDPQKSLMLAAIRALLTSTQDAGWPEIWPVLRDHREFGRLVVGAVSYGVPRSADFLKNLTEHELGDLCIWMLMTFPPSQSDHGRSGAMGPSDTAIMLRDHALEHLKKRSTFAACEAIRKMMESLPQYSWLNLYLEEAESLARAATWQPLLPSQFLELAANHAKRLVLGTEDLLELVLESLGRLNAKLHGELPASKDLWNAEKSQYWPKDEEDLSDYVARHLGEDIQHRGIIVNREVQIRRGTGDGTGESTDIHVDALVNGFEPGTYARAYLIIETKGNWHPQLFTNMETQLRDKYLKNSRCKSGIYLIGWFSCAKWKNQDYRKNKCPQMSLEEARKRLSEQAHALAVGGYDIRSCVLDCSLN